MKKMFFTSIVFIILLFSCQMQQQSPDIKTVTINGPAITSEEKSTLESLKPQVDRIIANVLGETRASALNAGDNKNITSNEINQIDSQVRDLLKSQFGTNYEKFFIKKTVNSPTSDSALKSSPLKGTTYGSTTVMMGQYSQTIRSGNTIESNDHRIMLTINIEAYSTPYYAFNFAKQTTTDILRKTVVTYGKFGDVTSSTYTVTNPCSVADQYIVIIDAATSWNGNQASNTNVDSVCGNIVMGSYPLLNSITTYHYITDSKVNNGSVSYGYNWWW